MRDLFHLRAARFAALTILVLSCFGLDACTPDAPARQAGPVFVQARPGAWDNPMPPATRAALNTAFRQVLTQTAAPALSIAVRSGNSGHWRAQTPASARRFWWASSGKLVTTILALQEVEAGRLMLDDALSERVPMAPEGITLRQLLTHTSGLADFAQANLLEGQTGLVDHNALVRTALELDREFAPAEGWAYSNTGFLLVQAALETVTGQSYDQLVAARIARLLGLDGLAAPRDRVPPDVALPALGFPRPASEFPPNIGGAGSVVASAEDMARFWQAAMAGDLVDPHLVQAAIGTLYPMFGDQAMLMGAGIILFPASDGSGYWLGHGGGAEEVGALVLFSPSRQIVIALAGIGPDVPALEIANTVIETMDRCAAGEC